MKHLSRKLKPALHKLLTSLALAAMLMAIVRVAHDLTIGEDYWNAHSTTFIVTESLLAWFYSIELILLAPLLMHTARRRGWKAPLEYAIASLFAALSVGLGMVLSHSLTLDGVSFTQFILPATIVVLFTCLYYAYYCNSERERWLMNQTLTLEKTRNRQLDTELRLLRAQYHPHFLFNMLNTIYVQIDESNEAPRHTIECLSEVLRYQLYSPEQPVEIRNELEAMEKFIELCRMRVSRSLKLDIRISNPPSGLKIYPLLLIPLVENAFKHLGGSRRISITFAMADGNFILTVTNTVNPDNGAVRKADSGLGLENLRRRLELLYPDGTHSLSLTKDNNEFKAILTLRPVE